MHPIQAEHPDYTARRPLWRKYRDLYIGGEQFQANAHEYLLARQKEPAEVYAERLQRAFYENYAGSIVDWYGATLFRREPMITFEGPSTLGGRTFFNNFVEDCDRKGTGLSDFFRKQFLDALVYGSSWTLVDFPRTATLPMNRAEEDQLGASRAYLVSYSPEELINWSYDEKGQLDWVVLRSKHLRQEDLNTGKPVQETRWHYYDKKQFRIYRQRHDQGLPVTIVSPLQSAASESIELIDEGFHALAKLERVPLFELKLTEGLWLMNKAATLQLEHFNKSNALSWALTMGLFAMPVIYSDREWNQIVGESYYIQLGKEDKFGWTEPEGHVYQIAATNLQRLKEEIYRVCYLSHQAGPQLSDGRTLSGLAKQRDFAITHEVLRAYGDMVKDILKRILRAIAAVRADDLQVGVTGLDEFDIGDFSAELDDAAKLLQLGINSPTLRQQIYKKLAFKYLSDDRQEVKDMIAREIESEFARQTTRKDQ